MDVKKKGTRRSDERSPCSFHQLGERGSVVNREVGEDLAIHLDSGLRQTRDQAAVCQAVGPGCRVDARDPQRAELAPTLAAVTVCTVVEPRFRV